MTMHHTCHCRWLRARAILGVACGAILSAACCHATGRKAPPLPLMETQTDSGAARPIARAAAGDRDLEDHLGGRWPLAGIVGGPAVLIIGGPSVAEVNTRWDNEVVAAAVAGRDVPVHRVVCLAACPAPFRPFVPGRLRASVRPAGTPVLMDWENAVALAFACDPGESTLLVVAGGGRVVLSLRGAPDAAARPRLARALDEIAPAARRS